MSQLVLKASEHDVLGKAVKNLRREGKLPVVAYGHGFDPQPLTVGAREVEKVYRQVGTSKLVSLKIGDGRARNALINDVQVDVETGALIHADLYLVRMDEELKAEVPLHFTGETALVYQQEGVLVKGLESVEVECLPADLPESIEVDISGLDEFEKAITLADLKLPDGVKLLAEDSEAVLVAKVEPPRSEEELAELDEEVVEELPEGVEPADDVAIKEENEGRADR